MFAFWWTNRSEFRRVWHLLLVKMKKEWSLVLALGRQGKHAETIENWKVKYVRQPTRMFTCKWRFYDLTYTQVKQIDEKMNNNIYRSLTYNQINSRAHRSMHSGYWNMCRFFFKVKEKKTANKTVYERAERSTIGSQLIKNSTPHRSTTLEIYCIWFCLLDLDDHNPNGDHHQHQSV